jgi:hypothetical protein
MALLFKKNYIIPTKDWLIPINKFLTKDINTQGILFEAELKYNDKLKEILIDKINNRKVIVKITYGKNNKIKKFNERIKNKNDNKINLPNFVNTYTTIICRENELKIEKNKQFCNGNDSDKIITLEIMDKYNNISSFINKNNKKLNILILQQLLLAQINLFKKFKYTHNDFHLGNILYKKHKDPITLNYKYIDKKIKDVKIEIILSDYDNVFEFTNENIERYILNELNSESSGSNIGNFNIYLENSLISNLIKTTNVILNTNKKYLEKFNKIFEKKEEYLINKNKEYLLNNIDDMYILGIEFYDLVMSIF